MLSLSHFSRKPILLSVPPLIQISKGDFETHCIIVLSLVLFIPWFSHSAQFYFLAGWVNYVVGICLNFEGRDRALKIDVFS